MPSCNCVDTVGLVSTLLMNSSSLFGNYFFPEEEKKIVKEVSTAYVHYVDIHPNPGLKSSHGVFDVDYHTGSMSLCHCVFMEVLISTRLVNCSSLLSN